MYIKDCCAISPQRTFDLLFEKGEVVHREEKIYEAIEPDYSAFIPSSLLRRMGKAVRMGIGAALPLLKRNEKPEGIIIGTANGGLENCILFLNQIVDYEEGLLTPTHFLQSTPNALAGQLALLNDNTGYNVTHVNGSLSFENALLDAALFLENRKSPTTLLVGAVEEISEYNYNIDFLASRFKKELVASDHLMDSKTEGSICGEGSAMFVVSNDNRGALAEILDVEQITLPSKEDLRAKILSFIEYNGFSTSEIDALLLGRNGDVRYNHWYDDVQSIFPNETQNFTFKQYTGEYRTSVGFALYQACRMLSDDLQISEIQYECKSEIAPKTILIYNHFDGIRHGFLLVRRIS